MIKFINIIFFEIGIGSIRANRSKALKEQAWFEAES